MLANREIMGQINMNNVLECGYEEAPTYLHALKSFFVALKCS